MVWAVDWASIALQTMAYGNISHLGVMQEHSVEVHNVQSLSACEYRDLKLQRPVPTQIFCNLRIETRTPKWIVVLNDQNMRPMVQPYETPV